MGVDYDVEDLFDDFCGQWEGDDYYLFAYRPVSSEYANQTTQLILDFKKQTKPAFAVITEFVVPEFQKLEHILHDRLDCRYIVSIPSSREKQWHQGLENLCEILAQEFKWMTHLSQALVRVESVPKSAWAEPGKRPDYSTHLETIRYCGPMIKSAGNFIMLDDIFTRKEVSGACRDILKKASGCERVIGFYLGRTAR